MALTLDPSKRNDIIIRQGQSLNFSFLLTNESDGEDFAVAGYTFNLEIYDRRRTKIFDLTDGEGLTVQDGSVAVSISANDLNIPDGDYKYFLVVTNPDAETNTWINGYAKVKDSLSIGSQDDVSVTVSNADNNVNITVGISGSTLSAGDQTKIDNLPENTTQELAGKADKAVTDQWSSELLFDNNYKVREKVMDGDIVYTKAESGNTPNSFIEDYVTGDGIHTITFDQSWYNGNGGVFDNTKVNAIIFYYDLNGRVRYTIENLETVIGLTQLATPTNAYAVSGGQDTINTGCDTVTNASSYKVYVSDTGQAGSFVELASGLATPSYQDTGLTLEQTRYYYWQAIGDGVTYSNSGLSATVSATTSSTVATPVLNDIQTYDSISNDLSWSNVSGESSYDIYRRNTGTTEWTLLVNVAANTVTYRDNTCTPEQAYDYSVIAKGNGSSVLDSSRSNIKSVITQEVLTPTLSFVNGDGQITVNITNIDPNVDSITLERSIDQSNWVAVEEYVSPNSSVIDLLLDNDTRYYYRAVTVVNSINSAAGTATTINWANTQSMVITDEGMGIEIYNNDLYPRDTDDKQFSVEMAIKFSELDRGQIICNGRSISLGSFIVLGVNSLNNLYFRLRSDSNNDLTITSSSTVQLNTWYHIIVTYNAIKNINGVSIYLNGQSAPKSNSSTGTYVGLPESTDFFWRIPFNSDNVHTEGKFNIYRQYNKALSASEVGELYTGGYPKSLSSVSAGIRQSCVQENRFNGNADAAIGTNGSVVGTPGWDNELPS